MSGGRNFVQQVLDNVKAEFKKNKEMKVCNILPRIYLSVWFDLSQITVSVNIMHSLVLCEFQHQLGTLLSQISFKKNKSYTFMGKKQGILNYKGEFSVNVQLQCTTFFLEMTPPAYCIIRGGIKCSQFAFWESNGRLANYIMCPVRQFCEWSFRCKSLNFKQLTSMYQPYGNIH